MIDDKSWMEQSPASLGFVLLATIWGASFVAIEVGVATVPPLLFAAVRYDVAGLLLLGYAAATVTDWLPDGRDDWLAVGVVAVLVIGVHHALLYLGAELIPGPMVAVVVSLIPVLTAVFAAGVLPGERLGRVQYAGVGMGFLGVAVIATAGDGSGIGGPTLADGTVLGVLLVFIAAAAFAIGTVFFRTLDPGLPTRSVQGWGMVFGAGLLHAASVASGEGLGTWTADAVAALAYLSVVASAAAFLLYYDLLDRLGPAELNLVTYCQPVTATLVSWAVLGYVIEPATVAGLATVLAGFGLVKRRALFRLATGVRGAPEFRSRIL